MKRKRKYLIPGSLILLTLFLSATLPAQDLYENLEFDMPAVEEPSFPDREVSLTDFDAKGDGRSDNSEAFSRAIRTLADAGGGKLIVPRGIWLTGPIVLESNINLHLEDGALIIFSPDKSKYPLIETSFEGLDTYRSQSPISGDGLENIAITGNGIIDGSGDAWRPVKKSKMAASQWKQLVASGGVLSEDGKTWYPSEAYARANKLTENFNVPPFKTREEFEAVKDFLRPVMVSLVNCNRVLLDGPTFQNSPAWNIHPLMCENVTIRNLTVRNPWYSQNGDGLDLESCKNVVIHDNTFDVGDDAICFKSGKNEDGRRRGIPTENVIVKNNIVYHGHGGFVVGSEMSGGVRNVHVSHCTFIGTDVGLRFKSTRGRGGIVENIYISDIDMINIPAEAIRFNMFYGGQSPIPEEGDEAQESTGAVPEPVSEETPSFRNIHMRNITVTGSETAALFQGLPEMKLQNVSLENAVLEAEHGITMIDAEGIRLSNVRVINSKGYGVTVFNSSVVSLENIEILSGKAMRVLGTGSNEISISDSNITEDRIVHGKEVKKEAVKIN